MPTGLKALPFDQKNQLDFDDMTNRIRQALELVQRSKSLKPTQTVLANLAKCSRRTLSLRRWPIEELKRIAKERRSGVSASNEKTTPNIEKSRCDKLIEQIRNYQLENGRLFDRVQALEEEQSKSAFSIETLEQQRDEMAETIQRLEKQLRSSKIKLVDPNSKRSTVQA